MKKFLAGIALIGTAASAEAADLPVRTPYVKAPVVATVYDWTGFYFGVNGGVGLGRDRATHIIPGVSADSFYESPQGGIGGVQAGYNWQTPSTFGNLVFGVEADIQGAGMRDSTPTLFTISTNNYSQQIDWFGTVRGRVGIATGPVLSYVTAGYAYGNVKTNIAETNLVGATLGFPFSHNQGGWTYGSGVEASIGGGWTAKLEYLYLNLGNKSDFIPFGAQTFNTEIRENIFRAGLNYRIGGNDAPAIVANWSGFYLGGNFGGGTARDRSSWIGGGGTESFNLAPDGVNGGVQAGYNWQAANWVFGVEADIQGSSQRDNKTCILTCSAVGFFAYDATLPWFGTARGRIGYSIGSTLFYATGGYAYGGVKTNISFPAPNPAVSLSGTQGGWTAGAGIETPFTFLGLFGPNWTSKTEYLYVDLGTRNDTFAVAGAAVIGSTRVQEHIFRTGLNYHFNSPVVAKY
jgi:outer membrane immunogenic protein